MLSLRFLKALLLLACAAALAAALQGGLPRGGAGEPGGLPGVEIEGLSCAPFGKAYITPLGFACAYPGKGLIPLAPPARVAAPGRGF